MFDALPQLRKVIGACVVGLVLCTLLLATFYYDLGSTGGTFAALGCALFITAIFAPIPRWLKISLETAAAAGLIRGGIMLGLAPGDTLFLTGALAFIVWLNWIDDEPPTKSHKKREDDVLPASQTRTSQQPEIHHLHLDC